MQNDQGVTSGNVPKKTMDPPDIASAMSGDFGSQHRGLSMLTSYDDFLKRFLPEIKIGDQVIKLSAELPPTPGHLTTYLLNRPDSRYLQLQRVLDMAPEMSDEEARLLAGEIQQPRLLPAPKPE